MVAELLEGKSIKNKTNGHKLNMKEKCLSGLSGCYSIVQVLMFLKMYKVSRKKHCACLIVKYRSLQKVHQHGLAPLLAAICSSRQLRAVFSQNVSVRLACPSLV